MGRGRAHVHGRRTLVRLRPLRRRARASQKPLDGERDAFLVLPGVGPAPYLGRFGWLALEVADDGQSYERFARGRGRRRQRPRTDTAAPTGREGR